MSADKYPSIFSRQMKAIVYISLKYRLRYFRLDEKPNQKPSKIYYNTKGRKKPVTRANRTEHFKEVTK